MFALCAAFFSISELECRDANCANFDSISLPIVAGKNKCAKLESGRNRPIRLVINYIAKLALKQALFGNFAHLLRKALIKAERLIMQFAPNFTGFVSSRETIAVRVLRASARRRCEPTALPSSCAPIEEANPSDANIDWNKSKSSQRKSRLELSEFRPKRSRSFKRVPSSAKHDSSCFKLQKQNSWIGHKKVYQN